MKSVNPTGCKIWFARPVCNHYFLLLFVCFLLYLFVWCFFLQDQMGKGRQPECCLCKPEGAVVKEMFDRVYLVVDCSVLFMYVQFLSCIG